jgi:hypothetical protein
LQNHWPVTVRATFYRVVTAGLLENTKANYRKVSRILTKARMVGFVPWAAIEDRVRDTHSHRVFSNQDDYIESEIEWFLDDYHRDLLQGQEHVIELWTEKDTMAPYLQRIVQPYRISVSVARGFSSLSFVRDLHDRCMQRHWDNEKPTLILYVGDADPSGMFMPEYMLNTLEEMFHTVGVMRGVRSGVQVNFQRITLTPDQAEEMDLPSNFEGIKHEDSRAARYIDEFSTEEVWEVDALDFDMLEELVVEAIEDNLDMDMLEEQRGIEAEELRRLAELKEKAVQFIRQQ